MAFPAVWHSEDFSLLRAGLDEEYGKAMPSASMAEAIVLAVYIPPQAPAPGMAWHSMPCSSASSILPAACAPTASKTLTTVRSLPRYLPGLIVPP